MEEGDQGCEPRRAQATQWFARLRTVPVSKGTLDAFFEWQRDPANAAAFEVVESLWGQAGRLHSAPSMVRLAAEAMTRNTKPGPLRPVLRPLTLCASVALFFVVSAGAWLILRTPQQHYATAIGQVQGLELADGSRVELNTDTRLAVKLGSAERRIHLVRGEALFSVAHDGTRPFLVTAGDVVVRATGTRFEVRHLDRRTQVILMQGTVNISVPGRPVANLEAGETWRSDTASAFAVRTVGPDDLAGALAWTKGRVVFEATPLADAIAEVNRYTDRKIVLAAQGQRAELISGSFKAGDPEAFAKAVAAMLALEIALMPDGTIALRAQAIP
jgi:transmembrane sensor